MEEEDDNEHNGDEGLDEEAPSHPVGTDSEDGDVSVILITYYHCRHSAGA